jgi:enoyl-CoA hydratase
MLRTERRGGVEILTIDRQQAGNSISSDLTTALLETLERLAGDAKLHSVVITGGGDKFFCTGGDVKEYRTIENAEALNSHFERTRRAMDLIEALPVPVIAAVNGYALGGGGEIMLCCPDRLAAIPARHHSRLERHRPLGARLWPPRRLASYDDRGSDRRQ